MAIINTILDKVNCFNIDVDSGDLGCAGEFGTPRHILLTPRGYKIPKTTDLNLDFIQTEIKKRNIIPLMDLFDFESASEDQVRQTSNLGVMSNVRDGLIAYSFTYQKSSAFHRELSRLASQGKYNLILIDDKNTIRLLNLTDNISGFPLTLVDPENLMLNTGSENEMKTLFMQIANSNSFNSRFY